ncbi:MAG: response regulator transcription factor [Deltaproteobacteria bacterium]|nr:response regulator transcription factor [Deltaproteobacteria bacterium]
MIKILIVEDQTLLRDALAKVISGQEEMQVAGFTANADEALDLCRKIAPDLALIDVVTQNKANGIAAAAGIRRELPDIKIVIMTALPEITFIDAARKAGAHSFVYKDSDSRHLLYVIRSTMEGQGIYPGPGDEVLAKARFTDTEIAIIRLVCQGKSRNEIAQTLAMSEGSVKAAITGILNKTGFDSIMKFSVYAVAHGFIVPNHSK